MLFISMFDLVFRGFPGGSAGKESTCDVGDLDSIFVLGKPPGKGMATHSSILARIIPWTEENSMESQRVGHDRATFTSFHFTHILFAPCLPSLPTSNCS